jgi:hypothetical protein
MGWFHSWKCLLAYPAKVKKEKEEREKKRLKEDKESSVKYWIPKLQKEVNKYVRLRDHNLPCISCGAPKTVQWEAGHYRSVGSCPELRFDLRNINKQCHRCNFEGSANYKGGKGWGLGYDQGIIDRFGQERLDWLNGYHEPKNYTAQELKEMTIKFRKLNKELEKEIKNKVDF